MLTQINIKCVASIIVAGFLFLSGVTRKTHGPRLALRLQVSNL